MDNGTYLIDFTKISTWVSLSKYTCKDTRKYTPSKQNFHLTLYMDFPQCNINKFCFVQK